MTNNLTLAITSVGDLLLTDKITKTQENKSIDNISLVIPDYQRPYKWSPKNAIQLLDDIIDAKNANKEVYRVGTLILHKETLNGKDQYNIVDGQQRTITFSLLLTALGEKNIKLLNQQLSSNEYSRRNVPNNYQAFLRRLKNNSADDFEKERERESLKAFIEKQCEMIVVITDNVSEAFQFFDSQNARGKSLYPHDLLKAYHLREMTDISESDTEKVVRDWESREQSELASLFGNYLYRIKEWISGDRAERLDESNIYKFKGVTKRDRTPYAQFYKAAYAYADMINHSSMPFVSGSREVNAFQIDTPIVAGKPFFDYAKHYYSILKDIQDNSKYVGFYINDNDIVKTLDKYYRYGTGNGIARLLFDTSVLLYVDRFCPETYPDKADLEMFDRYVVMAFVWAYSLRAQYTNLGWLSAQNYILGQGLRTDIVNSMNIYRCISQADSPASLLSILADKLRPLNMNKIPINIEDVDLDRDVDDDGVHKHYLHYFKENNFLI